ncbi:MAG: hypothetical protein QXH66_05480 [Conexivisphaerales archaeon]
MADRDEYNEKLVNEPFDVFVNADLINNDEQLKMMNEGKRGKPYTYSDILMLLAVKEYFGLQADRDAWWNMGSQDTQICRRQKGLKVPLGVWQ